MGISPFGTESLPPDSNPLYEAQSYKRKYRGAKSSWWLGDKKTQSVRHCTGLQMQSTRSFIGIHTHCKAGSEFEDGYFFRSEIAWSVSCVIVMPDTTRKVTDECIV